MYVYVTSNIEYWAMYTLIGQFEIQKNINITVQYFTNNFK